MTHAFATVAIGFPTSKAGEVEAILHRLGAPAAEKWSKALDETKIIHFMSIVVARGTQPEQQKSHLLIEVTADGGVEAALRVVAKVLAEPLERVWDIIDPGWRKDTLADLLVRNHYPIGQGWPTRALGLAHDGTPGISVRRLRKEEAFAKAISQMDEISGPERALHKLEKVREKLWKDGEHKWVFTPELTPVLDDAPDRGGAGIINFRQLLPLVPSFVWTLLWPFLLPIGPLWNFFTRRNRARNRPRPAVRGFAAAVVMNLIGIAAAVLWGYRYLRRLEKSDPAKDLPPDPDAVGRIMETEGMCAQGLLLSVSTMKPERLRRLTLRFAFWSIATIGPRQYRPGFLGPIGVIHFARWFLLPGTDRLFFWSNYDGAWESYVEDFIQLAHEGVTAIWSNTRDFPKTQKLFQRGAQDGDRLRRWARRQMQRPLFWYSAYPDLTLERIRANAAIRQGVATARTEQEAEDWLANFGSAPRPRPGLKPATSDPAPPSNGSPLDTHEIPTLVFGGRGHLRFGECLVITMNANHPAKCQAWLRRLEPWITYGDAREDDKGDKLTRAVVFGLSTTGFDKLGLPKEDLDTFPAIFRHGMTKPWRSRALGDDTRENEPTRENWYWGYRDQPADAVLLVYAATGRELENASGQLREEARENGQDVAFAIKLTKLLEGREPVKEPFGFTDGISQPLIDGTPLARDRRHPMHMVEPGEFVLGYLDNAGYRPSTPTIRADLDPRELLAEHADGGRDLGRNGSYLVVRQLEQKVDEFKQWLEKEAEQPAVLRASEGLDHKARKELIAAKLMGRWPDGASLVHHREPPKAGQERTPDNDFRYSVLDPQGLHCPLGAHIRRANPRDSLRPDSQQAIAITNRHRIIRVSRRYDPPEKDGNPGTLFMCLNADIERQFEFIQQTWLLGRSFQALPDESDAVIGCGRERAFCVPTRNGPVTLRGLPDFVRARGGGYFFMPGKQTVHFLAHGA